MKKIMSVFIAITTLLLFTACSSSLEESLQDVVFSFAEEQQLENSDSIGTEGSSIEETIDAGTEIDYSPYSALLKAYTLDYNIENISATDYNITGMTLDYTYPTSPDDSMLDASGFCYANLVDFDNNGVLELVLIAYDEQEWDDKEYLVYENKVLIGLLKYPNIAKIYTISPEGELLFLAGYPLSYFNMPVSMNFGIEYIVSENETYFAISDLHQFGDGDIYYMGMEEGYFVNKAHFTIDVEGSVAFQGNEYSYEELEELTAGFGESEIHIIENMDDNYLAELEAINAATFDFLSDYPVSNFESFSGAYNDGQFYYMEYSFFDLYPPEFAIKDYYKALTMRDYDALSTLGIGDEDLDFMRSRYNPDDPRPYVPGYIISNVESITVDMIEDPDMAADIGDYIGSMSNDNSVIMYCRINEVLDPHVSSLGLQVAGGTYDTYFIMYSDDPNEADWKISEIFDDKFYW